MYLSFLIYFFNIYAQIFIVKFIYNSALTFISWALLDDSLH